jgi:hypothetical protein
MPGEAFTPGFYRVADDQQQGVPALRARYPQGLFTMFDVMVTPAAVVEVA